MSRLIVNADDLGYTDGVNRAVAQLHHGDALSSATAMACGAALTSALPLLPAGLGVGCHVVLVDGAPVSPAASLGSLVQGGTFRPTLGRFAVAALLGRLSASQIEAEATAQVEALQAAGIAVTHLDTHKHTHLFPAVLRPLLQAARRCGIMAIRNPFEPAWARVATVKAPLVRRAQMRVFDSFHANFLREVDRAGLRTPSGALGVLATGVLDHAVLDRLLHALSVHGNPGDCYELVCHPAIHDAALDAQRTRLRAERQVELAALGAVVPRWTGPGAPHRLVTFADL